MEAEEHAGQLQELILTAGEKSRGESQDAYIENLRRALRSAALDKQAFHERIGAFVELIREGRLIIRKTRQPHHAKLYLFDIAAPFDTVKPRAPPTSRARCGPSSNRSPSAATAWISGATRTTPSEITTLSNLFRRRGAARFTLLHTADAIVPATVEEGIEAIRCEPAEPRVGFGGDFWSRYGNLCAYTRPAGEDAPGSQSWVTRARTQLAAFLAAATDTRRAFVELLIEDIQYFGTLSERTLRKLAKPDLATPEGLREIDCFTRIGSRAFDGSP